MSARHVATFAVTLFSLIASNASAQRIAPNALLTIDQNRATVVDRIVNQWGDRLVSSNAGITSAQLREILAGLRADHLLAAGLAGSVEGLRDVVSGALVHADAAVSLAPMHTKSLGDTAIDLVYTPIVPCRILDTRNGTTPPYNAPMMGGSAFPVTASLSNFAPQGGSQTNCNLPPSSSPIAAIAVTLTVLDPNFDAFLAASSSSNFATLTQSVVMDFVANQGLANTAIVPVDGTVKFYLGIPAQVSTNVIADAVGYFKRPTNFEGTHVITGVDATDSGGFQNTASGNWSTVAGGYNNTASDYATTVSGGINNTANFTVSTVSGGSANTASGLSSTVAGGSNNTASAFASTVAGGDNNIASGYYSFAAGLAGKADENQCFVFANWFSFPSSPPSCLGRTNIARFLMDHGLSVDYGSARMDGGGTRWLAIGDGSAGNTISAWNNATLTDAGVWVNGSSSKTSKTDFRAVDVNAVLRHVAQLPITTWRYKDGEGSVRHIGPMAEDFWAAFKVGYGDHTIADLDARGVALAAIQGLHQMMQQKDREIAQLRRKLQAVETRLGM